MTSVTLFVSVERGARAPLSLWWVYPSEGMRISSKRVLAPIFALLLATAPASAAAPCHCPTGAEEASRPEPASGCHASSSAPETSRDSTSQGHSENAPCQGACGACATAAGLIETRPESIPNIVVDRLDSPVPAMREGESRPPDHVPLPL